jgi:hypothetical protein
MTLIDQTDPGAAKVPEGAVVFQAAGELDPNADVVLHYMNVLQAVITRMAANSSSCKTLCVTLVSAIVVVITNKAKPDYIWVTLTPIVGLGMMDVYYLWLERGFRRTYNKFTQGMLGNKPVSLFKMAPTHKWSDLGRAVFSPSTLWFYGTLAVVVYLGRYLIFG